MTTLVALANHLWQSTLFAALVALAILAFRRNRASVRHALWLAASIKFLLPFAALATLGAQLAPTVLSVRTQASIATAIDNASQPFAASTKPEFQPPLPPGFPAPTPNAWPIVPIASTIWAAGALLILAAWGMKWRHVSRLVRGGQPIVSGREVDALRQLERQAGVTRPIAIVESPGRFEPGVFGIRRPVLLWPAAIGTHLDADQLVTILAHEVAHVRRRDNLTAAIQTVISALFWFHPLVWWIGARLADERERACDEEVLRAGGEPELYAESILAVCRLYLQAPPSCVAGVASSNLRTRIERIMTGAATRALSTRHKLLLAAITIATLVTPMAVGALTARVPMRPRVFADVVRFDAATVKPAIPTEGPKVFGINIQANGRFQASNTNLRALIQTAYRLQPSQIVGGPDWMASDRFDVMANTATSERADRSSHDDADRLRVHAMLRALLKDRFKLVARLETRQVPVYALTLASPDGTLGSALKPARMDCGAPNDPTKTVQTLIALRRTGESPAAMDFVPCGLRLTPGQLVSGGVAMSQLASSLSGFVDRMVIDQTGLSGNYEARLTWTPENPERLGTAETPKPSLAVFAALQEQLGLKLEPVTSPVDVLVIESAQPPSGN